MGFSKFRNALYGYKLWFSDILLSHAQTPEKTACFDPRSQGVFWTEGENAPRGLICPGVHTRPADPTHANVRHAGLCQEEKMGRRGRGERRGIWGHDAPEAGEAHRGCTPAEDRSGPGLAAGSLGAVAGRPGEHAPGIERARSRIRVAMRSARPHDPERQSARRHAGRVRRIRTGYPARSGEGGNRSSEKGREPPWAANDRRQARAGDEATSQGWAQ